MEQWPSLCQCSSLSSHLSCSQVAAMVSPKQVRFNLDIHISCHPNYVSVYIKMFLHVTGKRIKAPPTLLNWQVVHERMPWNIILLLGGGFALAAGSEVNNQKLHIFKLTAALVVIICKLSHCAFNCHKLFPTTKLHLFICSFI